MEFGSDFHLIDYLKGRSLFSQFKNANYYVSGRQAIMALAIARSWRRLWVPSYFCEESLDCFKRTNIKLLTYNCLPFDNPEVAVSKIEAESSDGILVVNYYGIHGLRKFNSSAEIVEDHTHNLIGEWSQNSKADWCIASLRKTLPIPDGGILWSPKGLVLPSQMPTTEEAETIMTRRCDAMKEKAKYLSGCPIRKEKFLSDFSKTEEKFDGLALSGISSYASKIISDLDIELWYSAKLRNHRILKDNVHIPNNIKLLEPANINDVPFSFCLLFDSPDHRNEVRRQLIAQSVYPAILWSIQSEKDLEAKHFGDRILSIHCDGRYTESNMRLLSEIINTAIQESCKS